MQGYFLSELIITKNCLQGVLKSVNGVESYRLLKIMKVCVYFNALDYVCARSQYWIMLGRLGFSLFQLKLSIIYTDNFCIVSLSNVERDNKKQKQNMFPFDFFVIDHFVANFDQKMLEKRDIKKNIFSMAFGRTCAWISILFSATDTFRIN